MSMTLDLFESLLGIATRYRHLGRMQDALVQLKRLADFPALRPDLQARVQQSLGELHQHEERFVQARRHFRQALALQEDRETRFRLAECYLRDPQANVLRARTHLRVALDAAPAEPRYLAAYGELALRVDRERTGLKYLARAYQSAPHDLPILEQYLDALIQSGRVLQAQRLLRVAEFQFPGDQRFENLRLQCRFQIARQQQRHQIESTTEPVLRFPISSPDATPVRLQVVRQDAASRLARPHTLRLRLRRFDAS